MKVRETALPGVLLIAPRLFADARGFFLESWNVERYAAAGIAVDFVQDNCSRSRRGVLRGLHYQEPRAQGKLVQVMRGRVFDVAVDIRRGSPNFGRWVGVDLDDESHHQLWIPPGFAHGFLVLSDWADVLYKASGAYAPECEHTILWNDPEIAIAWPDCGLPAPLVSDKDAANGVPLSRARLPDYPGAP